MHGWDYGNYGGMGWLGALMMIVAMIVFWGGLITVAILVIRHFGKHRTDSGARAILDERFARGEIDAEEYRARRSTLTG
ncbi:SHOCT domain-containing protein [Actinokineospora xionganensis]|uniref:SHOCT domain-containing protein n=1 Tax=Actinokineospora xionganensis TaxID=2684470 RepID=A0ABR7KZI2_9PSEU|nr:SHOCT domain-containing protein [Actinokineospora xionganensis]MBC6445847.1 SHOCT domain-containing protein [Actinokineospora xionganensis]